MAYSKKKLDVFQKNQYKIACDTLKMSDIGASIMGGMTKREAKIIKARLEKKMKG